MAAQDFDLSSNRAGTIWYGRTYKLMTIGRPPLPFGLLYLFIIGLNIIRGRCVHFFDHLFCVPLGWGAAVCLLDIKTYDGKNYFRLNLRGRPFNSEWWGLANFVGSEYLFSTLNSPDRK